MSYLVVGNQNGLGGSVFVSCYDCLDGSEAETFFDIGNAFGLDVEKAAQEEIDRLHEQGKDGKRNRRLDCPSSHFV